MKKSIVAMPLIAAALLSVAACAKQDDAANNTALADPGLDSNALQDESNFADGNDLVAPDNAALDNAIAGNDADIASNIQ